MYRSNSNIQTEDLSEVLADSTNVEVLQSQRGGLVKCWTRGVHFDKEARKQLSRVSDLPFIYKWVSAMPDVHFGKGSAIGSVIPTKGAIIPASVGVDIGCGMMAQKTSLKAGDLPDNLLGLRTLIEEAIPVGNKDYGSMAPEVCEKTWCRMSASYDNILENHPLIKDTKRVQQLGTLGGGNHFVEICLDENQSLWVMLHSGSRGVGNQLVLRQKSFSLSNPRRA